MVMFTDFIVPRMRECDPGLVRAATRMSQNLIEAHDRAIFEKWPLSRWRGAVGEIVGMPCEVSDVLALALGELLMPEAVITGEELGGPVEDEAIGKIHGE